MPTADLRALAERLGTLQDCGCSGECERCGGGTGQRLPTEAKVRAAIFEAGAWFIRSESGPTTGAVVRVSSAVDGRLVARVRIDETAPEDPLLLALLRALEVARGGA